MPLSDQINYLKHLKQLADFKFGTFSRFCQFCFVGGTGMVVDLLMYALFLSGGIPLILARGAAIWVAMTWNFWLNRRVTFSYSRELPAFKQYFKFLCSCSLGAVFSWSVAVGLTLGTHFFYKHVFFAAIIGIVIGTVCNFLLSLSWVFRPKVAPSPAAAKDGRQTNSLTQRSIVIVGIIALLTRLIFMGWTWTDFYVIQDDSLIRIYFLQGAGIYAGCGYVRSYTGDWNNLKDVQNKINTQGLKALPEKELIDTENFHPETVHPPGMALLIAGIYALTGLKPEVPVQLIGALLDSLAVCLLAYMAGKFFSAKVAILAGILYALYPPLAYASISKSPDGMLSVFVIGCLVCTLEGNQDDIRKKIAWWIAAGLVLGLGSYLRPDYLLVPFAIGVGLFLYTRRFLLSIASILLIQSVALIVLFPWAYRNHQLCGRWVFTTTTTGWALVNGLGQYNNPWGIQGLDKYRDIEAKEQGFPSPSSPEADRYFQKVFWDAVKSKPWGYVESIAKRLPMAIIAPQSFGFDNPLITSRFAESMEKGKDRFDVILSNPLYIVKAYWDWLLMGCISFASFLCSLFMLACERRRFGLIFLLLSPHLYSIVIHVLVVYEPRYVLPSMFSFLIGLAYVLSRGWKECDTSIASSRQPANGNPVATVT